AQLDDPDIATRERATAALTAQGPKVVGLLREAAKSPNPERARRAAAGLKAIAQNEARNKLPPSAPPPPALPTPAGAGEALLAYVAFTEDRPMREEIGKALKSLARGAGPVDPALVAALSDPLPLRRTLAAEALAGAKGGNHRPALRQLLTDADAEVRLRV